MADINLNKFDLLQQVESRVQKLSADISQSIQSNGMRASGQTQASLKVEVQGDHVILYGRPFFAALEHGSSSWSGRTGVPCSFTEFREIITQWIIDKGLHVDDVNQAAGAIAMTIIKKGSKTRRQGRRREVYTQLVEQAVKDIDELITVFFTKKIDDIILKWNT